MKDIHYYSNTASHDPILYYLLKFYPMAYFVWEVGRDGGVVDAIITFVVEFISCVQITLPVPEVKILFSIAVGCRLAPPTYTPTLVVSIAISRVNDRISVRGDIGMESL